MSFRLRMFVGGLMTCLLSMATLAGFTAGGGTAGAASAKGAPVKLMVIAPQNSTIFTDPEALAGAEAAAKAINKAGGVSGHPIQIISCDEMFNPDQDAVCAREAVSDGVAATVGDFSVFATAESYPILQPAGIPNIGETPLSNDDYSSSISFPLDGGAVSIYAAAGIQITKTPGCTKIAEFGPEEGQSVIQDYFRDGVKYAHGDFLGDFLVPLASPTWAPQVAAAVDKGANCATYGGPPELVEGFLQAIASNGSQIKKITVAGDDLTPGVIKGLGSQANGLLETWPYLPPTSPASKQFLSEMKAFNPHIQVDPNDDEAWSAVHVFAQAAQGLTTINASTVLARLKTLKDAQTDLGPVVNLSASNPLSGFNRLTNMESYSTVIKGGKFVLTQKNPINAQPALKAALG